MFKLINTAFVTLFGIGKLPKIPGSYASLVTVIFLYFLFHFLYVESEIFLFFLIGIFIILHLKLAIRSFLYKILLILNLPFGVI